MLDLIKDLPGWITEILKAGVVGVCSFLIGGWNTRRKLIGQSDRKAYDLIRKQLPEFREIESMYGEWDLHNSFETRIFHKFHDAFEKANSDPDLAFANRKLKGLTRKIYEASKPLMKLIGLKTYPIGSGEQSIKRLKYGHKEDDMATGDELNAAANNVLQLYKEWISTARKSHLHIDV
jgi:hypothetical protein